MSFSKSSLMKTKIVESLVKDTQWEWTETSHKAGKQPYKNMVCTIPTPVPARKLLYSKNRPRDIYMPPEDGRHPKQGCTLVYPTLRSRISDKAAYPYQIPSSRCSINTSTAFNENFRQNISGWRSSRFSPVKICVRGARTQGAITTEISGKINSCQTSHAMPPLCICADGPNNKEETGLVELLWICWHNSIGPEFSHVVRAQSKPDLTYFINKDGVLVSV